MENRLLEYPLITDQMLLDSYVERIRIEGDNRKFFDQKVFDIKYPQTIIIWPSGIFAYSWRKEYSSKSSAFHRDNDLPATIEFSKEGIVYSRKWFQDGRLHRIDQPASITKNQKFHIEQWYIRGRLHRTTGPASIDYINGLSFWHIHGKIMHDINQFVRNNNINPLNITDNDMFILKLTFPELNI